MSYFEEAACSCGARAGESCKSASGRVMQDSFHAFRRFNLVQKSEAGTEVISSGLWREISDDED